MIERNTVLILGAGASHPYGFPLGTQLRQRLIEVGGKAQSRERSALLEMFGTYRVEQFASAFRDSAKSIDFFLGHRAAEYGDIGKAAISAVICGCEAPDHLYNHHLRQDGGDWYQYLWERMTDGVPGPEMLNHNKLSIITFNYDRSVECYLHRAVVGLWGLNENDATKALEWLNPIHVYGKVGDFHPSSTGHNGARFDRCYDASCTTNAMLLASRDIKVIPEDRELTSAEFLAAREKLNGAQEIVFLGFGFDKINIQRLGIHELADRAASSRARVSFSSVGMVGPEQDYVKNQIHSKAFRTIDGYNLNNLMTLRHSGALI